ncbi:hypothetical protein [Nocardia gipuzkoensis]
MLALMFAVIVGVGAGWLTYTAKAPVGTSIVAGVAAAAAALLWFDKVVVTT